MTRSVPFWDRVDRWDPDQCWLWTGPVNSGGYGRHGWVYAHRLSYELHIGPIPPGLEVDHLCRVRLCVNPKHLEAVTKLENFRRSGHRSAIAAKRNICQRGHDMSGRGSYTRPDGSRMCRTCLNARNNALYHARKRMANAAH